MDQQVRPAKEVQLDPAESRVTKDPLEIKVYLVQLECQDKGVNLEPLVLMGGMENLAHLVPLVRTVSLVSRVHKECRVYRACKVHQDLSAQQVSVVRTVDLVHRVYLAL
jgi:hypothetical protein